MSSIEDVFALLLGYFRGRYDEERNNKKAHHLPMGKKLDVKLDFSGLNVTNDTEIHDSPLSTHPTISGPQFQLLYSSRVKNRTSNTSVHRIRTKRRADKGKIRVTIQRGFTLGPEERRVQLDLRKLGGGFQPLKPYPLNGTETQEILYEGTEWATVDTIHIPPGTEVQTDIGINQTNHAATFTIKTALSGEVKATLRDVTTGTVVGVYKEDVHTAVSRSTVPAISGPYRLNNDRTVTLTTVGTLETRSKIDGLIRVNNV